MKLLVALSIFISFLSGCTTTKEAMTHIENTYVGKNIDTFIIDHGIPYKKYQLNSGEFLYVWNSGVISYSMPTTTNLYGTTNPYGFSGTATTTGGGSIDVSCEVQIHTTKEGKILDVKPVKDTIGKWTTSRCAEIFK